MVTRPLLLLCLAASPGFGQQRVLDPRRPFEITDNSFLVEEAFNQEAGIFQNILLFQWPNSREWSLEFTQEWPIGSQLHQLSYTIPIERVFDGVDSEVRRGTIALNYRYQLTTEDNSFAAMSPRISFLWPDHPDDDRQFGLQFNFPLSKQFADIYLHANAGLTIDGISSEAGSDSRPHVAGSLIYRYRMRPLLHLMVESVYRVDEHDVADGEEDSWVISPGLRVGWNLGNKQLVLGVAVPFGVLHERDDQRLIAYFSYELPFMRR